MKNKFNYLLMLLVVISAFSFVIGTPNNKLLPTNHTTTDSTITVYISVYDSLHLQQLGLSKNAFDIALHGYQQMLESNQLTKQHLLSIVDMSLPSSAKRLFIIDLEKCQLLFYTYTAHGRNSGLLNAQSFSNAHQSFKSSIGFFATGNTYQGKHGYSMQLNGLEKGFNDNALSRGIVMHAAAYVNEKVVQSQGYLGRSLGCPAVPENLHTSIIKIIANGSCFFIYGKDEQYLTHSAFAKQQKSRLNKS
jgi:hypothetical protein